MSLAVNLAIGVAVVVAIVGSLVWLGKKGFFEPDTNDQEEREEHSDSVGSQDFRIPYRRRVKSWSGPYKVFVGSLALLAGAAGFLVYRVAKTGNPAGSYLTTEIQFAIVATAGVGGGVYLKRWFDSQIGYLTVVYQRSGAENLVERIPFARTAVSRRDGKATVPEVADNRLLALFWRFRQVGEDRRLRGQDKPLDDVITHKIPDHGEEIPGGNGYVVTTREDGDQILSGATSAADIAYSSPNSLSDERAQQMREKICRKDAKLESVQATNAELYKQLRKMRKKVKNEEYKGRTDLMEDFDKFSDMMSTFTVDIQDGTESESAVKQNGDEQEASA